MFKGKVGAQKMGVVEYHSHFVCVECNHGMMECNHANLWSTE